MGLTLLFITHDLAVASYLCSRIAVMYLGRIVETGPTKEVLHRPLHPYTKALLAASPRFFAPIAGHWRVSSEPHRPPSRMPVRRPLCSRGRRLPEHEPPLGTMSAGREVACLHPMAD